MKKFFPYILLTFTLTVFSCQDDYLETKPGEQYDDATIWSNQSLVESFVFNIYQGIPYPYQWYTSASLVDEAVPIQNDGVVTRVLTSTMPREEQAAFTNNWAACMENWWWGSVYSHIRACNLFFDRIGDASIKTEAYRQQLIGEVHFLRGYFYYLLMAQYGGVPLINYVVNIGDNYNIPRNPFALTIDFIIADLDAAITDNRLDSQVDKTRATKGAALAVKSRIWLYAASDLYNTDASWAAGYEHPELISYTDGNQAQRYQKAKEAAEAAMNLGYSLYNIDTDPAKNFQDLFLQMSSDEQIFITKYDKVNDPYWATDFIAWVYGTPSYGGWGLNQVTGNLANAFENANGTAFDFETQKDDPYTNRDPRFYATILHNGASWYINSNGSFTETTIDINGTDANGGNTTGYYIKKFISPTENDYYFGTRQPQPYIQIRYAEVLLNYAEACLALGEEGLARGALNQIRERAGMPDIPDTEGGSDLLARYRNERRVELAWENHRFFDVRRWMIAEEAYGPATGVSYDGTTYTSEVFEQRSWNNSHYFIPMGYDEMQKNTALIQNPGY